MLRLTHVPFLAAFILSQACTAEKPRKSSNPVPTHPLPTSTPGPQETSSIIHFFEAVPLKALEAGEDKISIMLRWSSNMQECSLKIGDESSTQSGSGSLDVSILPNTDVELSCGSSTQTLNVPVPTKMSIVRLTVEADENGERIFWDAFAAKSCELTDQYGSFETMKVQGSGSLLIESAKGPLDVKLICEDEKGEKVSAAYDVMSQISAADKLSIPVFTGPTSPVKKGKYASKVKAELEWKADRATKCQLSDVSGPVPLPGLSGKQEFELTPGPVTIRCEGSRFQWMERSFQLETRKELQLLRFAVPEEGLFASSQTIGEYLDFEVYGASSCSYKADNIQDVDQRNGEGILEGLNQIRIRMNRDTRELTLTCSNRLGESVTAKLPVEVKPRAAVLSFSVTPDRVTRRWTDASKEKVTLSWKVESHKNCELIRLGNEDTILLQLTSEAEEASYTTEVNETTRFMLKCMDRHGMTAARSTEVRFERQPELKVTARASRAEILGQGYRQCTIENPDSGMRWDLKAPNAQSPLIKETIRYPYLMDASTFHINCWDVNSNHSRSAVTYESPDVTYMVLRQATIRNNQLSLEAAWNLDADAQDCSLYKSLNNEKSLLGNNIKKKGQKKFSFEFGPESMLSLDIECRNAPGKPWSAFIVHPELACDDIRYGMPTLLGIPYDLDEAMSCAALFAKLQALEELEISRSISDFGLLMPYMGSVKKLKLGKSEDLLRTVPYLPQLTALDYVHSDGVHPELMKTLNQLRTLHMTFTQNNELDLRFLKATAPKLQEFVLRTDVNSHYNLIQKLNENLKGLALQRLDLQNVAVHGAHLDSIFDMPLVSLGLADVFCYAAGSEKAESCFSHLSAGERKLNLTQVTVTSDNIKELEKTYDPGRIVTLQYRKGKGNDRLDLSHYKNLQQLTLWNASLSNGATDKVIAGLKALELSYPRSNTSGQRSHGLVSGQKLQAAFPGIEQLTLDYAQLDSLSSVWNLQSLKHLSLNNAVIKHWDIPVAGRTLERLTVKEMPLKALWKELSGLKIGELVVDTMALDADELTAGTIDSIDLRKAADSRTSLKQLEGLFGKVRTIQLSNILALRLKAAVKDCSIQRVMQGTILVHPDLETDWKLCESL